MQHEFEDHWLSAYLDDELSADERALVEQRLAVDPVARELLEDLKRLRGLVATLPSWQGPDLRLDPSRYSNSADRLAVDDRSGSPSEGELYAMTEDRNDLDAVILDRELADRQQPTGHFVRRDDARRSMRWTAIIAVAAGLGALALGLPYLVQDYGSVAEVAQTTQSPASSAVPAQGAETTADADFGNVDLPESSPPENTDSVFFDTIPPAGSAGARTSNAEIRRDSGGKDLDNKFVEDVERLGGGAGSSAGANARAADESEAATKPNMRARQFPGREFGQGQEDAVSQDKGAQALAAKPPTSQADATSQADGAEAGATQNLAQSANSGAAGPTEEPSLYFAYSTSWAASEVDSAMPEVWYYVEPVLTQSNAWGDVAQQSANTRNTLRTYNNQAQPTPAVGLATMPRDESIVSLYNRLQRTNDLKELNRIPISNQMIAQQSIAPVADTSQLSEVASGSGADRGQVGQSAASEKLEAAGAEVLKKSVEETITKDQAQARLSDAAGALPGAAGEKAGVNQRYGYRSGQAQALDNITGEAQNNLQLRNSAQPRNSLALFVNVAEARKILSTLDSRGDQAAKPAGQGAVEQALPPAWWTRSRSLMDNRQQADDAKVILILNEPPAP